MKKKITPVVSVIILIFLVICAGILSIFIKKYTPSGTIIDGKDYFQLTGDDEAGLVVNHQLEDAKVKMIDGRYYVENSVVATYINSRFYWDSQQQVMLYTLPTEEFQIVPESTQYVTSAGTQMTDYVILKQIDGGVYLDLEFVSQYTDMTYTAFEDPARVVVRTKWNDLQLVTAQKNSEIRQKGGIKSPIVAKVKKGDTLYSIAQKYHCRVRTLLDLNPFVDIYNLQPGEEICVPDCRGQGKVDFRPYVVKEGDTLGGILKNVSMSFEELAKVNRILYNLIVPAGTNLLIPG